MSIEEEGGEIFTAAELLAHLRERGVRVATIEDGTRLRYDAPKGVVTPELLALLVLHKSAMLALLAKEEAPAPPDPFHEEAPAPAPVLIQVELTPAREPEPEEEKPFLEQFPAEHRGAIGNYFYKAARSNPPTTHDVGVIYDLVYETIDERVRLNERYGFGSAVDLRHVLDVLDEDRFGALAYAGVVLDNLKLAPEERAKQKAHSAKLGREQYMAGLPPTEKQLALLRAREPNAPDPANRLEASQRIDAIIRGNKQEEGGW